VDSTASDTSSGQPSLATLFSDLWRDSCQLVRQETQLATVEITDKIAEVGEGITSLAAGALVAFAGFLILLGAAVTALAHVLPSDYADWLSPLIVGGVVLVVGAGLLGVGRRKLRADNLAPSRTVRSLQTDAQMAKERLS
jgi:xanthine/uracil permease